MTTKELVQLYVDEQAAITKVFPVELTSQLCDRIVQAYEAGGTVYVAGNGGNAAFCDNFFSDLFLHPFVSDDKSPSLAEGTKRMNVVNLAVSPSVITAIVNDFGPDHIFSQRLEGHIKPADVFIGFSGSGNSANIIKAYEVAKKYGATTVGITRGNGGKSKEMADICIVIPGDSQFPGQVGNNNNNFHFEDYLSAIPHMITGILQKHVREKYGHGQ